MGRTKGGLNTKLHLAVDAHGMPVRAIVTSGIVTDCSQAGKLVEGIEAEHLLVDRVYNTNEVIEYTGVNGMQVVIPPKRNRKEQRYYDKELYKLRHLVENAFLYLKQWGKSSNQIC